jgi:hypothetical protein
MSFSRSGGCEVTGLSPDTCGAIYSLSIAGANWAEVTVPPNCTFSASATFEMSGAPGGGVRVAGTVGDGFTGAAPALWVSPGGIRHDGLTDNGGGSYSGTFAYSPPMTGNVADIATNNIFIDLALSDADDDGRFNALEVDALAANIGSTDPALVRKFDIDNSGTINQADVDHFSLVESSGFTAGLFGDANADGVLTCADRWAASFPSPAPVLGGASYVIQLDSDLDGDNDATDSAAFGAFLLPVDIDFNNDLLFPDTGDVDDLLSAYSGGACSNDPNCDSIDINMDGLFPDTVDIDVFVAAFSGGGC